MHPLDEWAYALLEKLPIPDVFLNTSLELVADLQVLERKTGYEIRWQSVGNTGCEQTIITSGVHKTFQLAVKRLAELQDVDIEKVMKHA